MVTLEWDGRVTFTCHAPDALSVELVGAFDGFAEQHLPMERQADGTWSVVIQPGPGSHLFAYRIDGETLIPDADAHGVTTSLDGRLMSRVWCPPLRLDPDSIAA